MDTRGSRFIFGLLALVIAALGVALAWRAYDAQDDVVGHLPEGAQSTRPPEYQPTRINEPDPPFPENVERQVMPVFNVSADDLPVQLVLPAQSVSKSLLVEGELTHDDRRFDGGVVRLTFLSNGAVVGLTQERSVQEEGRHVYRLGCDVPSRSGAYFVQISVIYMRLHVDPSESLGPEDVAEVLVAEGTVEFRE